MDLVVLLLQLGLAAVFVTAAAGKALDLRGTRQALVDFGVPQRLARVGAVALPAVETVIAIALLVTPLARPGGAAAFALLIAFVVGIARLMRAGAAPDCHCFGQIHSEPVGAGTLVRNLVLAAIALFVVLAGPGRSLASFSGTELALVITGSAAAVLSVAVFLLVRENRDLRKRPPQRRPRGLVKGSTAPGFRLPDVRGGEVALGEHLAAGRPAVLAFVSPSCGPCKTLLPDVARWQTTLSERLAVVAVSSGSLDANRAIADEAGLGSLLVANGEGLTRRYGVRGTPSAVLIAPDGTVGAAMVTGPRAIEALVRTALVQN